MNRRTNTQKYCRYRPRYLIKPKFHNIKRKADVLFVRSKEKCTIFFYLMRGGLILIPMLTPRTHIQYAGFFLGINARRWLLCWADSYWQNKFEKKKQGGKAAILY